MRAIFIAIIVAVLCVGCIKPPGPTTPEVDWGQVVAQAKEQAYAQGFTDGKAKGLKALEQYDLLLKKPSLLQRDFERKKVNEIYDEAAGGFARHANNKKIFFVYSDAFRGFASNALPSFWSEAASKSFKDAKINAQRF